MKETAKKPLGVIEALAGGFELILQRPAALIIPVALDLFVWLGPQISAKPLFQNLIALFAAGIAIPADAPAETLQSIEQFSNLLQNAGDTANFFGVISVFCLIAVGFPTVFGIQPPVTAWARTVWFTISDSPTFFALLVPLGLAGILVVALYLEIIARGVRQETDARTFVPRLTKGLATTTRLTVALSVGAVGFMLPLSIGATLMSDVSQGIASFLVLMGTLFLLWATLYLAFVLPAVFVSGSSARQAIFDSVTIFRFDFWSAMGLVILTYLIRWGFAVVWQFFIGDPWGAFFDVLANAFLGSGLVAATMLFYADRMNWLTQLREHIRQQQAQLKG